MIEVGNIVEVHLNTVSDAFLGIVLRLNDTMCWKNDIWYEVQPLHKEDMPGAFWYRENKVKFVADKPHFLSIDGGKSDN